MLKVYLTDLNKWVKVEFGHGKQDIAFIMRLKKIFLSTAELLEPVIPDDNDLSKLEWRATQSDLKQFQTLAINWQQLELRLRGYAAFAGKDAMDIIVQVAQQKRRERHDLSTEQNLNTDQNGIDDSDLLALDVYMLYSIHQQLDQLLVRETPYTQRFLQDWPEQKDKLHAPLLT